MKYEDVPQSIRQQCTPIHEISDGYLADLFSELQFDALQNLGDPNFDPKKPRTVTLTIKYSSDEFRGNVFVDITGKTSLVTRAAKRGVMMMGNINGAYVASERAIVQGDLFEESEDTTVEEQA